jgi:hypothetical protein
MLLPLQGGGQEGDGGICHRKINGAIKISAKAGIHKFLTYLDSRLSLPCTGYGEGVTNW